MDYNGTTPPWERHSQLNNREAVDLIDQLISKRIEQALSKYPYPDEPIELIKRQLTDYLLATDSRKGVYVKGDND